MHLTTSRKSSRRLPGSRLDFLEVVWTSSKSSQNWKLSGLPGSLPFIIDLSVLVFNHMVLIFYSFKGRSINFRYVFLFFRSGFDMQVFQIWKTFGTTYLRLPGSLPDYFHFSRLDFLKVVWTSWKSSGLPGSRLDFLEVVWIFWKSSDKVLWRFFCNQTKSDDLTFSRLGKHISKSIAKITSVLTRRLPAHIRLLQEHIILNESDPPRIVSFFDSINQWRKKKGKSILGALRASNWLFMVVRVLMTMAIL
ncbi:hypothetical protein IGI04_029648 [Brassica rapa subsp. trilocularis]|uniref:Reverse transcriptase zinc-binding domain-containing protein n=1 Tax=Brassica rapa subsp. trilocularis TaxID=1813537 RepID=A0ABQ7LPB2_BRACM|nr:hypothetical protein IGI04_029648 [Brassica rapa subsp. trilocularis]